MVDFFGQGERGRRGKGRGEKCGRSTTEQEGGERMKKKKRKEGKKKGRIQRQDAGCEVVRM